MFYLERTSTSRGLCTRVFNLPSPSETECYLLLPYRPWPGLKWCSGGNRRHCRWDAGLSPPYIHQNRILHLLHWWSPLWNQCCLRQTERVWLIMMKYMNCNTRNSVHLNPWTCCTDFFSANRTHKPSYWALMLLRLNNFIF